MTNIYIIATNLAKSSLSCDIKLHVAVILLKCYLVWASKLDIHITLNICSQPVILDCGRAWVFYLVSLYARGARTICIQILFLFSPPRTTIFEHVSWQFPATFMVRKKMIFLKRSQFSSHVRVNQNSYSNPKQGILLIKWVLHLSFYHLW